MFATVAEILLVTFLVDILCVFSLLDRYLTRGILDVQFHCSFCHRAKETVLPIIRFIVAIPINGPVSHYLKLLTIRNIRLVHLSFDDISTVSLST